MGYWGGTYLAHLLTPGYFSDSHRKLIRAHVSNESLSNRKELGTNSDSYLWWANGDLSFAREKKPVSTQTFIPVVGDFDGNGLDDIFWYQPGTAFDVMWLSNMDRTWREKSFTANEVAVPVAGDFDGNGTPGYPLVYPPCTDPFHLVVQRFSRRIRRENNQYDSIRVEDLCSCSWEL